MESHDFEPIFAEIEKRARNVGAEVELPVDRAERLSISFQKGSINKFDSSTDACAGLRVINRDSVGYAFTENLASEAMIEAFNIALTNADFSRVKETLKTAPQLLRTSEAVTEMRDLHNSSLEQISMEEKIDRARLLESIALETDKRIAAAAYSGYAETDGELQILTTTGLRQKQRWTSASAHSYSLAKHLDESRMGGESEFFRDASRINVRAVAEKGARLALAKLGSETPATGRYPIVFDAEPAMSLIRLIADYFSAKAVDEQRSIFTTELGKAVASSRLTLTDDPHYQGGLASRAFDSEGAATRATPLIVDGVLKSFLTNSYLSRKLNLASTANASRGPRSELSVAATNLVVTPGQRSLGTLLNSAPRMIFVTGVTGLHAGFRESSGDFSLQAEGELWENGQRVRPLCNFVVSGNVRDLLMGLEEVSDRVLTPRSSVITPDLFIRELSVAGK